MTTDEELVRMALEGSEDAYTELYARLLPRMRSVAWNFLRNSVDIEDAPHDFITQVFAKLGQFHAESKFTTWAISVAQNFAMTQMRKVRSTRRRPVNGMVYLDDVTTLIQIADKKHGHRSFEARSDLKVILSRLTPGYRNVLEAKFLGEQTHEEIGRRFGITTGCSKSQTVKGLRKARTVMEGLR